MSVFKTTLLFCICIATVGSLQAVQVTTRAIKNPAIYGIEFPGDSRAYYGREEGIQSISKQEYVTATFRVTEVNIVTAGSALLRIYYSRPLRSGELQQAMSDGVNASGVPGGSSIIQRQLPPQIQALADRASGAANAATSDTVIKEYPIATHARTIEYRIADREELIELYDELKKHWLREPGFYEGGQLVDEDGAVEGQMRPRNLGGTLFSIQE